MALPQVKRSLELLLHITVSYRLARRHVVHPGADPGLVPLRTRLIVTPERFVEIRSAIWPATGDYNITNVLSSLQFPPRPPSHTSAHLARYAQCAK